MRCSPRQGPIAGVLRLQSKTLRCFAPPCKGEANARTPQRQAGETGRIDPGRAAAMFARTILLVFLIIITTEKPALSKERETQYIVTGNDLHSLCLSKSRYIEWFVAGVLDGYERSVETGSRGLYCIPNAAKTAQIVDLSCIYIRSNPQYRHYSAAFMIQQALIEAWPCP